MFGYPACGAGENVFRMRAVAPHQSSRIKECPMRLTPFARAGVLMALFALVCVAGADEVKVELKDVPNAVLNAVKATFPQAELLEAMKETEEGRTIFEITLKDKGQKADVSVTADGKITEIEKE